jgi:single-strand DNA-binding protein
MNKVILMGRLTRDPEVSSSTNGTTFARYSIAVDRRFKREGEPDADFFNCTSFGKQAEFTERYLRKGTKVVVTGRIQNDNYTNKEGQKVYGVRIMVEEVEFAESKNASSESSYGGGSGSHSQGSADGGNDFLNVPDGLVEELPFS